MFCPKCGAQLPDDAAFCPVCGEKIGAPASAQPTTTDAPSAGASTNTPGFLRIPNVAGFISLGVFILTFIFGFLPQIAVTAKVSAYGYSASDTTTISIMESNMFEASFLLGMGKVFMIISIIVAVVYLAWFFIDFSKLSKGAIPENILKFVPLAYFGVYALSLLLTFIGSFTFSMSYYGMATAKGAPAVCWFFAAIFCACGIVLALKPNLLDNLLGKAKK